MSLYLFIFTIQCYITKFLILRTNLRTYQISSNFFYIQHMSLYLFIFTIQCYITEFLILRMNLRTFQIFSNFLTHFMCLYSFISTIECYISPPKKIWVENMSNWSFWNQLQRKLNSNGKLILIKLTGKVRYIHLWTNWILRQLFKQ